MIPAPKTMTQAKRGSVITAADVVDETFCCPLIGLYPCERERRGCSCHELHLINQHDIEVIRRQRMGTKLRWKPEAKRVRIIYSDAPGLADVVTENPGKVFAVIGPFDGHMDKEDLQLMLYTTLRGFNLEPTR